MKQNKKVGEDAKAQKRKQIMIAAMEMFAQKGYHTCTISDITKRAGIAKGLVYNYFDSKEDLMLKIVTEGFALLIGGLDANHDGIVTKEEFKNFVDLLFKKVESNKHYWMLYYSILLQPDIDKKKIFKMVEEIYQPVFQMVVNYYQSQNKKNPVAEVVLWQSLLDGIVLNYLYNENYPLDEIKQVVYQKFI